MLKPGNLLLIIVIATLFGCGGGDSGGEDADAGATDQGQVGGGGGGDGGNPAVKIVPSVFKGTANTTVNFLNAAGQLLGTSRYQKNGIAN